MKRLAFVLFITLILAPSARPDEGMWMPEQIPALAERLKALGFQGDAKSFADLTGFPMGAIVSLGGCSASFVSPESSGPRTSRAPAEPTDGRAIATRRHFLAFAYPRV